MKILALDTTMKNTGYCVASFNMDTQKLNVEKIGMIITEKTMNKQVRANSDDIRRIRELSTAIYELIKFENIDFIASEIPSGSLSASAARSFGLVTGMLAAISVKTVVIEVLPKETKTIGAGIKNASKEEMIEWAVNKYPKLSWKRVGDRLTLTNEHMADAIAVAHAAIHTQQFLFHYKIRKDFNKTLNML